MTGRGSGVPIPLMELFQFCDFGSFQVGKDRQTLATVMIRVFQEGYDARFGTAMAIPVLINELMIRTLWVVKQRFYGKQDWKHCIPTKNHSDLRAMLLIGYGALCLLDGIDAGIKSGGNSVAFLLRLNIIAWIRLILLIFKELRIRYGDQVLPLLQRFMDTIGNTLTPGERRLLLAYNDRIQAHEQHLAILLQRIWGRSTSPIPTNTWRVRCCL